MTFLTNPLAALDSTDIGFSSAGEMPAGPAATYRFLDVACETDISTFWCYLKPAGRPNLTPGLLRDITAMQARMPQVQRERRQSGERALKYFVQGSRSVGVYNFGGDLEMFIQKIRAQDRDTLRDYAYGCVRAVHNNHVGFNQNMVSIAMVQGDALGGGFEAALSCNVIVAERQAKFGLPEVLFNMFPGMGAYSFIARRLGPIEAEKMIVSGRIYSAEEMHALGLVDVVAEEGAGEEAVRDYIDRHSRKLNTLQALMQTRRLVNPVTLEELLSVTDVWVDAALKLTEHDMRKMLRLTAAQDRRLANTQPMMMAAE